MERKSIVIKNDVYMDKAFYLKKYYCHTDHVEMCSRCRLRFHCWTMRANDKTMVDDLQPNYVVYRGDITLWLSKILAHNTEHRNIEEFNFMIEEYLFGHTLNLEEAAKVKIW